MSAVLKEYIQELAIVENKSLAEILVISDELPADFYKNTELYQKNLEAAIASAKSLVHDISDEGRKLAKADAALIRKFAKQNKSFSMTVFKSLTEKIGGWKGLIYAKADQLEAEADSIISRFSEHEAKQLEFITKVVNAALTSQRTLKNIEPKFMVTHDLSALIKLTGTLTPGQQLTKKANDFIDKVVDKELLNQSRYHSRVMELENLCLRADINPPLTEAHLGAVFFAEDDVFRAKANELITTEIARKTEMELRIEAKNKADNQKKIDDALAAQQAETNRIANEKIKVEEPAKPVQEIRTPELLRARAASIEESAQYADRRADKEAELKGASDLIAEANALEIAARIEEADALESTQAEQVKIPGKKTVTITANFEVTVSERISVEAVVNHLKSKLSDDLKEILIDCTGY